MKTICLRMATKQKVMGIDLALKLCKSVRNDNINFNYTA